mmetsp:Transcript_2892/g.18052  ORF Transcript_2892/g.18052 Transcript_2892/m.18052 type:complete len:115 (+) Transcript_2892:1064-1408(+)
MGFPQRDQRLRCHTNTRPTTKTNGRVTRKKKKNEDNAPTHRRGEESHLHASRTLPDAPAAALHAIPVNTDAKDALRSIARRRFPCSCHAAGGHAWTMVQATVSSPCSDLPDTRF